MSYYSIVGIRDPDMRRTFVELPAFTRLVSAREISDVQVAAIQDGIQSGGGTTIGDTGGVRKIRCAEEAKGKSGGWRALFADYDRYGVTVLIWAFPKDRQANLTAGQRKVIRGLKRMLDEEVEVRYGGKQ
jgi:hypothetical protein